MSSSEHKSDIFNGLYLVERNEKGQFQFKLAVCSPIASCTNDIKSVLGNDFFSKDDKVRHFLTGAIHSGIIVFKPDENIAQFEYDGGITTVKGAIPFHDIAPHQETSLIVKELENAGFNIRYAM